MKVGNLLVELQASGPDRRTSFWYKCHCCKEPRQTVVTLYADPDLLALCKPCAQRVYTLIGPMIEDMP